MNFSSELMKKILIGIVGIIIGAVIGYSFFSFQASQNIKKEISRQSASEEDSQSQAKLSGLRGVITEVNKKEIMLQELLTDNTEGPKSFKITTSDQTTFRYVKPQKNQNDVRSVADPKLNNRENVKKGMYAFIITNDDPLVAATLEAAQVLFSEEVPKKQSNL